MGLSNNNSANKTYLNMIGGNMAKRVPEGTEGAVTRTNKNGSVVNEILYDTLEGRVTSIDISSSDYGKTLEITMASEGENFQLNLSMNSRYAAAFLMRSPNIDYEFDVTIKTFVNAEERGVLYMIQKMDKVFPAYTKDNPGELPQMEQITVNGALVWDASARLAFFESKLVPEIKTKINDADPLAKFSSNGTKSETVAASSLTNDSGIGDIEGDDIHDLPF